jgi:hypothetical protein
MSASTGFPMLSPRLKDRRRRTFVFFVPMLLALSVSACATNPPARTQESTVMTTAETSSGTDNPALSAEQVGRRFLKLIESVKSRDDLTREHVQAAMGLTLGDSPNGPFHTQPLDGDWLFVVSLGHETPPGTSISLSLEFIHKGERFADMSSVCAPDFEAYHDALKASGYRDAFQYDQINGEVGRLVGVNYTGDGMNVDILPEVRRFPDGKVRPACVRRISLVTTR